MAEIHNIFKSKKGDPNSKIETKDKISEIIKAINYNQTVNRIMKTELQKIITKVETLKINQEIKILATLTI
ncbi:MAG TPA: hypothetical protein VFD51_00795 [Patescibacteria group bacterium]|nr:hypothetical protein [Patescibacteria group bacterium]